MSAETETVQALFNGQRTEVGTYWIVLKSTSQTDTIYMTPHGKGGQGGNWKQQLELDMEQQTGSKLGKEYIKAVYCHPTYLTYMHYTSHEMPG